MTAVHYHDIFLKQISPATKISPHSIALYIYSLQKPLVKHQESS